ncbi:flotillin family protein [Nocardioides sp. zg-536]|uniref:Flotillin family protein n=1 Tax=Nocardioides faecalis TaxID=2803858 RepID=A0A938Y8N5_9ACTN|nr:flotillin family protein [Nocardioides faecalis]MBM9459885.1 flotillin family protein [Nocardioides faecalis]MBS4754516.1 flotillin family protein [Nocardioides faecalis]QVI58881.1 flotillin family protein [Nocardioides faecalis]
MSSSVLVPIAGIVVLLVLLVLLVTSRYKVAGPNQAFIVTGRKGKAVINPETGELSTDLSGQKVVLGGGVFVVPFVQKLATMDLSSRRISVQIRGAVSGQGIKLNLDGVAIVKVGGNADQIRLAAQRFLSQQADIEPFTQEVLAGALRSIVGGLTVEQIIRDRAAFAQRVADESESSLTGQGLILDAFQIQDVTDDGTYLADLGRPEAARIEQAASIAEAEARRAAEQARIRAEEEIAIAQRQLALKQAEIKSETDAASAQAAAAGPLAQADRDQAILLEQEKVAVRQAALTERQLETQVRKPADAERYRVEQEAEARRTAEIAAADARKASTIAAAQAKAEETQLSGEAEKARRAALAEAEAIEGIKRGEAEKGRRVAEADALRAEGEAQAAATLAIGQAEAEAMDKRAEAFAHYNDAAVLQMLIEVLPQIAKEVASPIAAIDQLTILSTDGAGALPKQVTDNVTQTLQMLKTSTGLDLESLIHRSVDKAATGMGVVERKPAPADPPA